MDTGGRMPLYLISPSQYITAPAKDAKITPQNFMALRRALSLSPSVGLLYVGMTISSQVAKRGATFKLGHYPLQIIFHHPSQPQSGIGAVRGQPLERRPVSPPHCNMRQEGRHPKLTIAVDKPAEIRKHVRVAIRNSLEAIKRNLSRRGDPRNHRRLHIHQHRLMLLRQAALLVGARHAVQRYQPKSVRTPSSESFSRTRINDL